jgi:hypothetical protein
MAIILYNALTLCLRAVSVPIALLYVENRVEHAICRRLSCCSYVVTRIRVLPRLLSALAYCFFHALETSLSQSLYSLRIVALGRGHALEISAMCRASR